MSGGLPPKSAMETALRYMELASARHDKDALTVSGSGEGAEIYRDAAKCIAFAMNALPQAAPDTRKAFAEIKRLALNVKSADVPATLARIVRLCIDAGAAPPAQRNWTEDAAHENGNYECRCVECEQPFIGHKRRVVCKSCSTLTRP